MIDLTSIEASACCVENSGVLALSSCLGLLVDSDFFGPRFKTRSFGLISAHDVFAARFHEPMTIYKDVYSIARIGESANANFYQIGSRYAVFLSNIYGNTTAEQKNIAIVQKSY
jgi:hypothetical protein